MLASSQSTLSSELLLGDLKSLGHHLPIGSGSTLKANQRVGSRVAVIEGFVAQMANTCSARWSTVILAPVIIASSSSRCSRSSLTRSCGDPH